MEIKLVFLIGFMGCGKSTLGHRLANELGWSFADMDDLFEKKHQTTISSFFNSFGEEEFRKAEHEILLDVAKQERIIISTGGGTPCFFDNLEIMNASGLSIYLKVSVETLSQRLRNARQVRPLIAGKSIEELHSYVTHKLAERELFYKKARIVADAETLGVEGFVNIIETSGKLMK